MEAGGSTEHVLTLIWSAYSGSFLPPVAFSSPLPSARTTRELCLRGRIVLKLRCCTGCATPVCAAIDGVSSADAMMILSWGRSVTGKDWIQQRRTAFGTCCC